MTADETQVNQDGTAESTVFQKRVDRRRALSILIGGMAAGAGVASACSPLSAMPDEEKEAKLLAWREYIKGNYRTMTEEERAETIARLERLAKVKA